MRTEEAHADVGYKQSVDAYTLNVITVHSPLARRIEHYIRVAVS